MDQRRSATRPRLPPGANAVCVGADYSDEERQFLLAVERFKRTRRRPFPTWKEILLHVVKALGYRRPDFPD